MKEFKTSLEDLFACVDARNDRHLIIGTDAQDSLGPPDSDGEANPGTVGLHAVRERSVNGKLARRMLEGDGTAAVGAFTEPL